MIICAKTWRSGALTFNKIRTLGARAQQRAPNDRGLFATGCKSDCLTENFNRIKSRLIYIICQNSCCPALTKY